MVWWCWILFSSVQSLSRVRLFVTPWIAARQASLSITNSRSLLKLMSIKLVMPSNHLILYHPLLLLPPIPPSIRVFSNESTLRMRWPKYWSFSFSISPSNEHPGLISFRMDWLDLLAVQFKSILNFSALRFLYSPTLTSRILLALSNMNKSLAWLSIFGCRFFPFITLIILILCHFLLAYRVPDERSVDNYMGISLYVSYCF